MNRKQIETSIRTLWRDLPGLTDEMVERLVDGEIAAKKNERSAAKVDREGGLTSDTDDYEEAS